MLCSHEDVVGHQAVHLSCEGCASLRWICGTELHELLGGPTFTPVKPHPITKEQIPITLGHEFSGVVRDVGPDVTDCKKGQNVVVRPPIYCQTCGACKSGVENTCDSGGTVGLGGYGGGLAGWRTMWWCRMTTSFPCQTTCHWILVIRLRDTFRTPLN